MVERKRFITRATLWSLVIGIMVGIFCFSSQPAGDSRNLSDGLLYDIIKLLNINVTTDTLEFLSVFIRKAAHFSIYASLGFTIYMLMVKGYDIKTKVSVIMAPCICAIYAITDELHQTFVSGRSGEVKDVLLDTAGSLAGMLAAWAICAFLTRRKKND